MPTAVLVEYIDEHRDRFGVEPICQVLRDADVQIAPSTYYAAKSRPLSAQGCQGRGADRRHPGGPRGEPRCLRRPEDPCGLEPGRRRGRPLHRRAADARRGHPGNPARQDPQDHLRRRRGDRPARRSRQARVHRDGTEPALGCGPDLHPCPCRVGLRRVRPRGVLSSRRRLAGRPRRCAPISPSTRSTWASGSATERAGHHRADPSQRCRSAVSSDSLHRALRRSRRRRVRRNGR